MITVAQALSRGCLPAVLAIAIGVGSHVRGRAAEPAVAPTDPPLVRVGYSQLLFAGVNQNDAHAAMKVYAQNIAGGTAFTTDGTRLILDGTAAIARAIRLNQVELLTLTSAEFLAVEDVGVGPPLLMTATKQDPTEKYVLLVRDESPVRKVEDLNGRSLIVSSDVRASLAHMWLEVLFHRHGIGAVSQALAKTTSAAKPTQVLLPVFFRQVDACVVTRHAFTVMAELNPQLKKQLRVVTESPPVVPVLTCFRRGFDEQTKQRVVDTALQSQGQPSFRQVLALFKSEQLVQAPASVLDGTRELVAAYRRLIVANDSQTDVTTFQGAGAAAVVKGEGK